MVKESKAVPHPPPGVRVREWSPYNDYKEPFMLKPLDLNWSCPTVQRLWFGTSQQDKQKRLRAFFAVMKCDDCPPMLSQANIPQHLLLLACVLRYLMTGVAMRKPELDAMLVTAFSPELRNPRMIAEMRPANITSRGVRLATMINNVSLLEGLFNESIFIIRL